MHRRAADEKAFDKRGKRKRNPRCVHGLRLLRMYSMRLQRTACWFARRRALTHNASVALRRNLRPQVRVPRFRPGAGEPRLRTWELKHRLYNDFAHCVDGVHPLSRTPQAYRALPRLSRAFPEASNPRSHMKTARGASRTVPTCNYPDSVAANPRLVCRRRAPRAALLWPFPYCTLTGAQSSVSGGGYDWPPTGSRKRNAAIDKAKNSDSDSDGVHPLS